MGAIESVRAAIADWGALTVLVNHNGASLHQTEKDLGISLRGYQSIDQDADGIFENYTMSFRLTAIPPEETGSLIRVSPSGIDKDKIAL
ncbi:MAG: hypothetical protein ETSY2_49275 [Candidatus Entotheonella gemina]|uniref:Uncharacterized protein n=1 Tax=Candidatus Entotheonella gemina TaxID=1429439 RepID=W4LBN6_9BACT|nr:MAG: hypothetical protein ETSY2_49275 [Candidatus Entotheonella gemina]